MINLIVDEIMNKNLKENLIVSQEGDNNRECTPESSEQDELRILDEKYNLISKKMRLDFSRIADDKKFPGRSIRPIGLDRNKEKDRYEIYINQESAKELKKLMLELDEVLDEIIKRAEAK